MADGVFQLALRSTFALICCVSILPADIVVADGRPRSSAPLPLSTRAGIKNSLFV